MKSSGKKNNNKAKKYPILASTPISKKNLFLPGDKDSLNDDFNDLNANNSNYLYVGKQDNHLVADAIVSSSQGVLVTKIMEFFK